MFVKATWVIEQLLPRLEHTIWSADDNNYNHDAEDYDTMTAFVSSVAVVVVRVLRSALASTHDVFVEK